MMRTNTNSSRKDDKSPRRAKENYMGKNSFAVLCVLASLREQVSLVLTLERVAK
jgi:hypothetical protein